MRNIILAALMVMALVATAFAQEPVSLIDAGNLAESWAFGNGPEFPGARGKLEVAAETYRDKPVLSLQGDFSQGGNYVQTSTELPEIPVDTLSFWMNAPAGASQLTVRLVDASEQCHQIRLKLNDKGGWQQVVFPIEEYFKTMGTPAAPDIATQYEKWGGANDGKWHQPGKLFVILFSRATGIKGAVRISDALLHPSTTRKAAVSQVILLDEMLQAGEIDWGFNLGQEFAGAKGGLELARDQPAEGQNAMRLHADFTGGGAYVGVRKSFAALDVQAMKVISMKMRSESAKSFSLRLVDGTGQCHQKKGIPFYADGKWHEVELVPTKIAGGEHWGGANDGKWHDSVQLLEIMLNLASDAGKRPELFIADMRADAIVEAKVKASAFTEDFEGDSPLRTGWQTGGAIIVEGPGHAESAKALHVSRTLERLRDDAWAQSPVFDVSPGAWQARCAWKAELHSPDNSYHGSVALEVLDRGGRLLETIPVGIGYGNKDWQQSSRTVEFSSAAKQARFRIQLNKTYGSFWLDELSASALSVQPVERRIERILLATDATGNLFLPGDKVTFRVSVEAAKPLAKADQVVRYSVRDYWGALQLPAGEVALQTAPRKEKRFVYTAKISIPPNRLVVGKYNELHVEIPQQAGEPVREYSGLAVLPGAPAKNYAPEQIPFTIRNWDSRVPAYFDLADRIGLRQLGVWGGWSAKPPYKPHLPGLDRCAKFGAKWITGTPAATVERKGFSEYSEEALRRGMKNFLEQYADKGLAMIAMGNEPHGVGDKVLENVRAYKAIYETVKAHDPKIHVIGTSVEPNEEYFKAGYQNYLDSFDFHIYEHYDNVRRTMREYRALMKKYDCEKPIHSTELGLNSQGQTRRAVALEMIKKFTVFFAEGGSTASWFTIQYPDPKGKARGQFGDSHCVFDCKYSLYNPRLDAIVHYNVLNALCDKKFVQEKRYPNGVQAYLFKDREGRCLQVLWSDEARRDILLPLHAEQNIELIHLDGSRSQLSGSVNGIALSVSDEPVLLLYTSKSQGLGETLGEPLLSLAEKADDIRPGATSTFSLKGRSLTANSLRVQCPPLWKATLKQARKGRVECMVRAPESTPAREARIYVQLFSGENFIGELTTPVRVLRAD